MLFYSGQAKLNSGCWPLCSRSWLFSCGHLCSIGVLQSSAIGCIRLLTALNSRPTFTWRAVMVTERSSTFTIVRRDQISLSNQLRIDLVIQWFKKVSIFTSLIASLIFNGSREYLNRSNLRLTGALMAILGHSFWRIICKWVINQSVSFSGWSLANVRSMCHDLQLSNCWSQKCSTLSTSSKLWAWFCGWARTITHMHVAFSSYPLLQSSSHSTRTLSTKRESSRWHAIAAVLIALIEMGHLLTRYRALN